MNFTTIKDTFKAKFKILKDTLLLDKCKNIYKVLCDFLKVYPLELSLFLFIVALFSEIIFQNKEMLVFLVSSIGIIFSALKYKLDQANYHRELFKKRYKIFSTVNDILKEFTKENTVTCQMNDKMSIDLMRRSRFLFNDETYQFLDEFRIQLNRNYLFKSGQQYNIEQYISANEFLSKYVDIKNLAEKFRELKINSY
jgi:hypothetical protein